MMLIQDTGPLLAALTASQPYLEKPLWLILAIAGPLLIALLLVRRARDRQRRLRRFGNPETVARLLPAGAAAHRSPRVPARWRGAVRGDRDGRSALGHGANRTALLGCRRGDRH